MATPSNPAVPTKRLSRVLTADILKAQRILAQAYKNPPVNTEIKALRAEFCTAIKAFVSGKWKPSSYTPRCFRLLSDWLRSQGLSFLSDGYATQNIWFLFSDVERQELIRQAGVDADALIMPGHAFAEASDPNPLRRSVQGFSRLLCCPRRE